MPVLGNNRPGTSFLDAEVADVSVAKGMCYHQIDVSSGVGSVNVLVDWGTGARTVKTINRATADNLAILIFGDIKSIQLSPSGVTGGYVANYIAKEM